MFCRYTELVVIPSEARDLGLLRKINRLGEAVHSRKGSRSLATLGMTDSLGMTLYGAAENEQPLFSHVSATYTSPRINQRPSRLTH